MAGNEQVVNHREEAGQGRGGYGRMAIGTHVVSGLGEKEGGKCRVGEFWCGAGLVALLREGWGAHHGEAAFGK